MCVCDVQNLCAKTCVCVVCVWCVLCARRMCVCISYLVLPEVWVTVHYMALITCVYMYMLHYIAGLGKSTFH